MFETVLPETVFGLFPTRNTLGCSPLLDAQEPLTRGIPQSVDSWAEGGIPPLRAPWAEPTGIRAVSAEGPLGSETPRLRNISTEEFLASWIHGHLAHQNRTIAIASDFRVDGAKSPEILQKEDPIDIKRD